MAACSSSAPRRGRTATATIPSMILVGCRCTFSHSTTSSKISSSTPFQRRRAGNCVEDRKSTRLNSSHVAISYAVYCLKKKKQEEDCIQDYQTHTSGTSPEP